MFSSVAAGPFQQRLPASTAQTPFQRLKPVCVELLSLTGRTTGAAQTAQVVACLRRLKSTLRALLSEHSNAFASSTNPTSQNDLASSSKLISNTAEPVLTPSLINYVFYPLSELISTAPKGIASLPEMVAELTLDVLALLCNQWWAAWASASSEGSSQASNKQWQVWCDLVILSSSLLGSPSSKDVNSASQQATAGDEVKLAAIWVLVELLSPRFKIAQSSAIPSRTNEADWEWDGVSELPDLEEMEHIASNHSASNAPVQHGTPSETDVVLVFPTREHLSYATTDRVAKGAISFVLSSSFSIAESPQECTEARAAAIGVARNALLLWIGGTCALPSASAKLRNEESVLLDTQPLHCIDFPTTASSSTVRNVDSAQKAVAQRLCPLLPGITSSLTRLATSRMKTRQDGVKLKPTPSAVAAGSIELLGDLFRATLSDACLEEAIAHQVLLSSGTSRNGATSQASAKVSGLEDFAEFDNQQESSPLQAHPTSENVVMDASVNGSDDVPADPKSKEAQWALSTLAQVHLALKTFSSLTQPSLPGTSLPSSVHTSVQKGILRLALVLLTECAGSFAWLDGQLEGMARLNPISDSSDSAILDSSSSSSINTLLTWIVDLASDHNSESIVAIAKSSFDGLQKRASGQPERGEDGLKARLIDGSAAWSILVQAMNSLPSAIVANDDGRTSRLALRADTALELLSAQARKQGMSGLAGLSKLAQDIQNASVRLIGPLKVERLTHVEDAGAMPGSTTWRLQPLFAGLEASTSNQLSRMFFKFGRSLALSLVHELKNSRAKADAKVDVSEVFSMIIILIERAARLRSVRLEGGTTPESARSQETARRNESLTSLILAADMLRGVSGCLDNIEVGFQFADMGSGAVQASKQARKLAHKLGKKLFALVMDMLDGDAEEAIASRSRHQQHGGSVQEISGSEQVDNDGSQGLSLTGGPSESTLVERVKGIPLASDDIESTTPDRHGPALDLGFVRAADLSKSSRGPSNQAQRQLAIQHQYQQAERTLDLSNALLFELLSSTSKLLGQSFRNLLLRGSYPLISGMSASSSPSSELVRQSSASAMKDIAFNTAYADVKNCLLDHADYILGAACQRLISGLDEELRAIASADAPFGGGRGSRSAALQSTGSVGVASRDMVVLPLVSAQRAPFVLVEMIRVLGSEIVPMVEDAIDEILDALDRFHHHPTICDGLLAVLDSILETMAAEQATKAIQGATLKIGLISPIANETKSEVEDFSAWLASRKREASPFDGPAEDSEPGQDDKKSKDEDEDKPSKSQQVASQILTKASSFLTHPSPILRSRVLGLLQHGIETLAPQSRTAELLPIVNSAWPFVMTRLGASYSTSKSGSTSKLVPIIDLNPASIGSAGRKQDDAKWFESVQATFVERDPQVWVAAARFVESAAKHVPEFVGKRVVEEAWPRFEELLRLMRWKFDPRSGRRDGAARPHASAIGGARLGSRALLESETQSTSAGPAGLIQDLNSIPSKRLQTSTSSTSNPHSHIPPPFILPSSNSIPAQLTLCIVTTLTTIIQHLGARMPDEAAWNITIHPSLLDLLDARQPPSIARAAERLYIELGRRNPEATTWAIQTAFPYATDKVLRDAKRASKATPCFMNHAKAIVHPETLHCVVSSFTSF